MSFRDLWRVWSEPSSGVGEALLIFGSLTFIVTIAFVLAVRFRSRRQRRHLYRHHHHHAKSEVDSAGEAPEVKESTSSRPFRRRRHRRQHRTERPLNPTLAQVGGLPPIRPEDEPPKI